MRLHALRLRPGTDLRAELDRFTREEEVLAGFVVSCVGSLSQARLRMPGAQGEAELFRTWEEATEITSLVGTLSPDGLHLHLCLSRRDASCIGGHLVPGCIVNTTAELVIGEAPGLAFRRPPDPATGYRELSVEPRPQDP